MRRRTKQRIALALLGAMLVLLATQYRQGETVSPDSLLATQTQADYFMQGAKLSLFSQQGQLKAQLAADKIEVFESSKQSHLLHPVLMASEEDNKGWQLRAPEGVLDERQEQLQLNKKVIIALADEKMIGTTKKNPLRVTSVRAETKHIETSDLLVSFASNKATSDAAVIITAGNLVTSGKGLVLDLTERKFSVLHQVETRIYEE